MRLLVEGALLRRNGDRVVERGVEARRLLTGGAHRALEARRQFDVQGAHLRPVGGEVKAPRAHAARQARERERLAAHVVAHLRARLHVVEGKVGAFPVKAVTGQNHGVAPAKPRHATRPLRRRFQSCFASIIAHPPRPRQNTPTPAKNTHREKGDGLAEPPLQLSQAHHFPHAGSGFPTCH